MITDIRMIKERMRRELESSLMELEKSILLAKQTLVEQKDLPTWILQRLDEYLKIVDKQKKLAAELILNDNLENVFDVASKINVLSGMIADDSADLIESLLKPGEVRQDRKNYINC
ncbi:MAG: hypothetical protein NZO16_04140 [Deltaproteobacteria bacterium]|nr:hypothetical protein [Deltaproteobacteria bacterium]